MRTRVLAHSRCRVSLQGSGIAEEASHCQHLDTAHTEYPHPQALCLSPPTISHAAVGEPPGKGLRRPGPESAGTQHLRPSTPSAFSPEPGNLAGHKGEKPLLGAQEFRSGGERRCPLPPGFGQGVLYSKQNLLQNFRAYKTEEILTTRAEARPWNPRVPGEPSLKTTVLLSQL